MGPISKGIERRHCMIGPLARPLLRICKGCREDKIPVLSWPFLDGLCLVEVEWI